MDIIKHFSLMKTVLSLNLFLLFSIAFGGPKIEFDMSSIDLGKIKENESPEVVITFKNTGDEDLIIQALEGSCYCQELRVEKDKLSPGQSSSIHAKVIPKIHGGEAKDGIIVKSNDKKNPEYLLEIRRFVIKHIVVEPDNLLIKRIKGENQITRKVSVFGPTADHDFKVVNVLCEDSRVKTEFKFKEINDDRSLWDINLVLKFQTELNIDKKISIKILTSDKDKSIIDLPILLENNIPVTFFPKSISWIIKDPNKTQKSIIKVVYSGNMDFIEDNYNINLLNSIPDVKSPDFIKIKLTSTKRNSATIEWLFEATINKEKLIKNTTIMNILEFELTGLGISFQIPISVIITKSK